MNLPRDMWRIILKQPQLSFVDRLSCYYALLMSDRDEYAPLRQEIFQWTEEWFVKKNETKLGAIVSTSVSSSSVITGSFLLHTLYDSETSSLLNWEPNDMDVFNIVSPNAYDKHLHNSKGKPRSVEKTLKAFANEFMMKNKGDFTCYPLEDYMNYKMFMQRCTQAEPAIDYCFFFPGNNGYLVDHANSRLSTLSQVVAQFDFNFLKNVFYLDSLATTGGRRRLYVHDPWSLVTRKHSTSISYFTLKRSQYLLCRTFRRIQKYRERGFTIDSKGDFIRIMWEIIVDTNKNLPFPKYTIEDDSRKRTDLFLCSIVEMITDRHERKDNVHDKVAIEVLKLSQKRKRSNEDIQQWTIIKKGKAIEF